MTDCGKFFIIYPGDVGTEAYQDSYVHGLEAEVERLNAQVRQWRDHATIGDETNTKLKEENRNLRIHIKKEYAVSQHKPQVIMELDKDYKNG